MTFGSAKGLASGMIHRSGRHVHGEDFPIGKVVSVILRGGAFPGDPAEHVLTSLDSGDRSWNERHTLEHSLHVGDTDGRTG